MNGLRNPNSPPNQQGEFNVATKKFGRSRDVEGIYSIKRGSLYNAERLGLVQGVVLRLRGSKNGIKLWDMGSIERWIRSQMEAANQDIPLGGQETQRRQEGSG